MLVLLILPLALAKSRIIVDPQNPAWLSRTDGSPYFLCAPGDPEGFLYRGSRRSDGTRNGDQISLINKLKATGANGIYFQAIRSHGGDGDSTHNPFNGNNPSKGINAKILDQWDSWFSEMDKNDILIYFFFYDDDARIWNTGNSVGNDEKNFIRTIVNKFEKYNNLIWVVAEEYSEEFSKNRVSNIASEIRKQDDFNHPIAVHQHSGLNFDFASDPNIDQFSMQYNVDSAGALHSGMVSAWNKANGRYNLNMAEAANHGSGSTARKKNWATAMGGAYVMVLGWDISGTSTNDLRGCGILVDFFESTNFNEMEPHDELRNGGTQYVLAKPGQSYIAYASSLSGSIGIKGMSEDTYEFTWLDIPSGRKVQQTANVGSGDKTWSKPSNIGNELVVYIRRSEQDLTLEVE